METNRMDSVASLRGSFSWMTVWFSLNHACVTVPIVYASSVLDPHAAYTGSGLMYLVTIPTALFLAVPIVNQFGCKSALLFGMTLYVGYAFLFSLA